MCAYIVHYESPKYNDWVEVSEPFLPLGRSRMPGEELDDWYHRLVEENDQLKEKVSELEENQVVLTAALRDAEWAEPESVAAEPEPVAAEPEPVAAEPEAAQPEPLLEQAEANLVNRFKGKEQSYAQLSGTPLPLSCQPLSCQPLSRTRRHRRRVRCRRRRWRN